MPVLQGNAIVTGLFHVTTDHAYGNLGIGTAQCMLFYDISLNLTQLSSGYVSGWMHLFNFHQDAQDIDNARIILTGFRDV